MSPGRKYYHNLVVQENAAAKDNSDVLVVEFEHLLFI